MTTPLLSNRRGSVRHIVRSLLAAVLFVTVAAVSWAADTEKRNYSLAADDASVALKQFSAQSGKEIVYSAEAVRGVRLNEVSGEFTALEAVNRLIAGTDLQVVQDAKTGAIAINRLPPAAPAPAVKPIRSEGDSIVLDKVEISASKVGGLNNQTIFRTDGQGALGYNVITRTDIEHMGVTSLEELFRLIPQTTDYGSVSLQGSAGNPQVASGATYQNSEVKLRGFSSLQTSILVNGRRLQRGNLTAGPDLNRIPAAAIERIEILPSSASAIYGGGAIGGAINIILRKDYTGRDVTLKAGTSWDGGGSTYGATYFEGRSLNDGKTNYSFTLDYQQSEPLYNSDRGYLNAALARYPANTPALVGGRSVYEQYILQGFNGMPGTILLNAATGSLPIPGVTGARFAKIPANQDGSALTPSSFVAGAGAANLGDRFNRSVIYRPEERYSFTSQLEHEFIKDKLSLYAEVDANYFRSSYSFPQSLATLSLTATDTLNPFRTGVTPGFVGVPILVYYDPVDLPDPSLFQERQGARVLLGVKGKIADRWEWSLDGTGEYGRSHSDGMNPTQNLNTFLTSTQATGLTLAQRRALYNPLGDHRANPASASILPYLYFNRQYTYYNNLAQANFRVAGDLFNLPAGPVVVSPGAEVIWNQYQTKATTSVNDIAVATLPIVGNGNSVAQQARRTESVFLESVVPIIGPKWRPIPIYRAELNLGARWEGTDDSTDKTSPVIALLVAPTQDFSLRASYAEGFLPPEQTNYENPRVNDQATTPFTDPARGNLTYNYVHTELSGGNSNLKPELSKAWNYGVVFTPRFVPGLTATVDYWRIEKKDAILIPTGPSAILADPASFPGRVIRAAPSATDIANGWLGEVLSVDYRATNVGFTETNGIDFNIRYTRKIADLGTLTSFTNVTWTDSFRDQILLTNPIVQRVDSSGNPLRWNGTSSLFWEQGRWTTGVTATYIHSYQAASTTPSPAFPTGNSLDGERIPSALLWDLQLSYEIPAMGGTSGWSHWLSNTKYTLGVRNVFDKVPAFRTDIYSYYSRYEDPRQRFVSLQVKKSF